METKNKRHQNLVITDASGIISMVVETDTNHVAAKAYAEQYRTTGAVFYVPGELFAETLNHASLARTHDHSEGRTHARQHAEPNRRTQQGGRPRLKIKPRPRRGPSGPLRPLDEFRQEK